MAKIVDIAAAAGVSIGTVDRVLHNRGRVSEATREKVLGVAKELNYQTNLSARRLKTYRQLRVAVVTPQLNQDQGFWHLTEKGVLRAERELQGLGLEFKRFHYDRTKVPSLLSLKGELENLDGIVLAALMDHEAILRFMESLQSPLVTFDAPFQGRNMVASYWQDGLEAGRTVGHWLKTALRRDQAVAMIGYQSSNPNIQRRLQGFQEVLAPHLQKPIDRYFISDALSEEELKIKLHRDGIRLGDYQAVLLAKAGAFKYSRLFENQNKRPLLVGFDPLPQNIDELRSGRLDAIVSQRSSEQVYRGCRAMADHLLYGRHPQEQAHRMPVDILNPGNIEGHLQEN